MKRILFLVVALLISASYVFATDPAKADLLAQGFDSGWAECGLIIKDFAEVKQEDNSAKQQGWKAIA